MKVARDHVAALLNHARHAELADTARLLVSEIVTNVVVHTVVPFVTVETAVDSNRVVVAVYDASSRLPVLRDTIAEGETGRGLKLVQLLAANWGVARGPQGKRTWFELDGGAVQVGSELRRVASGS